MDIWDRKYRLKKKDGVIIDETIDHTYQRVARALAEVERTPSKREEWYGQFLWALRAGAIPAGRIVSNAGAQEHKPATSTINCTVSGTVHDSMNDILCKVHEAGLTLKAGCGIGYEFSTLRPKGAYVSGAGAFTSGPLSFMDIYDKMCFTVSSAGGRRGAQMATFDVGHPDILDFIRAKRENGRLRQFNLSLLITRAFLEAVRNDEPWKLAFPLTAKGVASDGIDLHDPETVVWRDWPVKEEYVVNEAGQVACKVYKTVRARRIWDVIMSSTYDFAEPGFILIDEINEMNNNWFCEDIRATNPCVTADTWVQTSHGPRQVADLLGQSFGAVVDGQAHASHPEGFFKTGRKPVLRLKTKEGYQLRLTSNHPVRRISKLTRWSRESAWVEASQLRPGDRIVLHDHGENPTWAGPLNADHGYLLGLLVGDGTLEKDTAVLSVWTHQAVVNGPHEVIPPGVVCMMQSAASAARSLPRSGDFSEWHAIPGRSEFRLKSTALRDLAYRLGMHPSDPGITAAMERASSTFYEGFLRGLFDAVGSVQSTQVRGIRVRLRQSDRSRLQAVQRMLLRLGIVSTIDQCRPQAVSRPLPDGRGGARADVTAAHLELVIRGSNLERFARRVGFAHREKQRRLEALLTAHPRWLNRERFVAEVLSLEPDGVAEVFDVQIPGINTFDANGIHAHNCGEQPLPPYGSCLLGSINLTKFVLDPFTEQARFDWETYRQVVAIFTRMLDNVVELNGLPLAPQRDEIVRKRRHGMGFLGLGSTLTMLRMRYGSVESLEFTEHVTCELAVVGWQVALELAKEKAPAPIMEEEFTVTSEMLHQRPEMARDGLKVGDPIKGRILHARYSRYMQRLATVAPKLVDELAEVGARFTHHSSIAPTGTISLSLANNASNGIEPSFAHHYSRNVIREGRKTKEKVDVYSFELLAHRELVAAKATPDQGKEPVTLPDYFVTADDITPRAHVDVQAAAQKWIDSSISKTANVPTDYPYEDFKDIYLYAYQKGLKGCTTFRFNPQSFQGVLVKDQDLENTTYYFTLEDGTTVEVKGNDEIEYDGETHTAANLYDAIKEGYYGRF